MRVLGPCVLLGAALGAGPAACMLDPSGASAQPTGTGTTGVGGSGGDTSVTGSGGAGGAGGAGGGVGGGNGGGGGMEPPCGNGIVGGGEACDDGNTAPGDGCFDCNIEPGYICTGEPSGCVPIEVQVVTVGPGLAIGIADNYNGYQGTIATMQCATITLPDLGFPSIKRLQVTVGMEHPYLGDLIVKLVSPAGTVLSLMSRPGFDEPVDAHDEDNGDGSDLVRTHPIIFQDNEPDPAEAMGTPTADNQAICRDDGRCVYAPSPGAGPGNALSDFAGEDPAGDWLLCAADCDTTDVGTIDQVTLSILAW